VFAKFVALSVAILGRQMLTPVRVCAQLGAVLPSCALPLVGGMLFGLSALMLLGLNGRIAGISGITAGLLRGAHIGANDLD